jgi:hypothetical protein
MVVLLVPTLAALAFAGLRVYTQIRQANDLDYLLQQLDLHAKVYEAADQVQKEGVVTAQFAASSGGDATGLNEQQRATDDAIDDVRAAAGSLYEESDPTVRADYERIFFQLNRLPVLRQVATGSEFDGFSVASVYSEIVNSILQINQLARSDVGGGQLILAAAIAQALGRQAIVVHPESLGQDAGHSTFLRLQRLALLGDLVLVWRGAPASWPAALPVATVQAVTLEPGESLAPVDDIVDIDIQMPLLGERTLGALYRTYLPDVAEQLDVLVGQPRVGDLADAAAQRIATVDDLRGFLRRRNGARTAQIGRVERATYTWDDLVLAEQTEQTLRAFADEARRRAALLADEERRRLFADTAQLSALFTGPPGLGKSMSAKVIARALGLDLLVVDSAAVTSKFIGETAKNLTRAFEVARDAQCALMFEEADSFFTTRVKVETANDRHSNADIGHLLQLMEHHDGVVMLSSNRRTHMDAAFTRRLRFIVEFRKPGLSERQRLWELTLAALKVPRKLREELVPRIAAAHELTPAQIKGAALTAAYRADADRGITADDIERAARLELQKEGRLISAVPDDASAPAVANG